MSTFTTEDREAAERVIKNAPLGKRCLGCGSSWDDERLALEKRLKPELISCCPDRKMVDVYINPPAQEWTLNVKPQIDLKLIQDKTNWILDLASQSKADLKGVNWGDLGCADVMECRSVYGGEPTIMVIIEEVSPSSNLGSFVYTHLHKSFPDVAFDIRTEW